MFDDKKCYECDETFNTAAFVRRHVKSHGMSLCDYTLKWRYSGIVPICKCGCEQETAWNIAKKGYAEFIHGHHMTGSKRSDITKQKIGEKNSVNMRRYMSENSDVVKQRVQQMKNGRTCEVEVRRINASRNAVANETIEQRITRSDHTRRLWHKGNLNNEVHARATQTWKKRFDAGLYKKTFEIGREKLSKAIAQKYIDGGFQWSRGMHMSSKTGVTSYYRSSWERKLMCILDDDPDVVLWEYEFIALKYEHDGHKHHYIPDFHVCYASGRHMLIEVKPKTLRETTRNVMKRNVAKTYCHKLGWDYLEWAPDESLSKEHT